jgi:hypothetical protein
MRGRVERKCGAGASDGCIRVELIPDETDENLRTIRIGEGKK